MSVNLRSGVGIATIWLATVAGVSGTAWFAIDRAGRDIRDPGAGSVNAASLGTTSDTRTPGSNLSPTGGTSGPPVTIGPATGASQIPRDRSLSVGVGEISVRCTGATILLRIAQPSDGWRVDVNKPGPRAVDVVFENGDEAAGISTGTRVTAVCKDGTPAFTVATTTGHNEIDSDN